MSKLHALAIDAAIWAMPIVSFDAMRQAFFRDAQARYHDIVYWEHADWKLRLATPTASALYVYSNINTAGGPIVVEIPRAVGAALYGSILDAWQVPVADIGPNGADLGRGGKYLIVPPDFIGEIAQEYIPVRLATHNAYMLLRALPEGNGESGRQNALAIIKRLRIYPVVEAACMPEQRFVDMTGKLFDAIVRFDVSYFWSLARMVNEEPRQLRDEVMLQRIATLGIERGATFSPGKLSDVLAAAASDAHAWFVSKAPTWGTVFWRDHQWCLPSAVAVETGFTFVKGNELVDVQSRGLAFFLGCAPPARLGKASFHVSAFVDDAGRTLAGDDSYRLRIPPHVPAARYWTATLYDATTAAFVQGGARVELGSYDPTLQKNADGSCDLYFGPSAPPGREANWLPTPPRTPWFLTFRLFGPQPPLFSRDWQLPDIEKL
jgi:hypothetical protein